jgi:Holliday junction resolvase-like predicted endonuclease
MASLAEYRHDRPHWSYSSINQLLNICGLQWALQRIHKMPPAFTPLALAFGSAFHRAMEFIALRRKEHQIIPAQEAADLFDDLWTRQMLEDQDIRFDENATPANCAKQGRDMVACIVSAVDPDETVVAVNEAFCVPLIDAAGNSLEKPLVGEIDLVVEKAKVKKLVDWKTSARRWPKYQADHSMQATILLYAYKLLHGMDCEFRFDVVVKNKTPVFEQHPTTRTSDQYHRMIELVKMADAMVRHEHFYPNEAGYYCSSCPYTAACSAWHRNRTKLISIAA